MKRRGHKLYKKVKMTMTETHPYHPGVFTFMTASFGYIELINLLFFIYFNHVIVLLNCYIKFIFLFQGQHLPNMPGHKSGPTPVVRFYGVTAEGNSVLCHIHGFVPYFYLQAPPNFKEEDCEKFRDALYKVVMGDMRSNKDNVTEVRFWEVFWF